MTDFLYTRIVLVLAGLGLVSAGVGGVAMAFRGQPVAGLVSLILAVGLAYFWIKDWQQLGKCASALARAREIVGQQ
jgi:hypothetical protein